MEKYEDLVGLDVLAARQELNFPIKRLPLVTQNQLDATKYDVIERGEDNSQLGIIQKTRDIVPYPEIMDWLTEEFDEAGLEFKLKDSLITNSGEMYQEYVFKEDVETPDGVNMSPLVVVKASYVGAPMETFFGTYRFVCRNGVMTGETISKIHIGARTSNFVQDSIKSEILYAVNKFADVSKLYSKLDSEEMNPYLLSYLLDGYVTAGFKKAVLLSLKEAGSVEILKDKIKSEDYISDPESIYNVIDEISAWQLYNIVTNVVSKKCRNANSRFHYYNRVSKDFGI